MNRFPALYKAPDFMMKSGALYYIGCCGEVAVFMMYAFLHFHLSRLLHQQRVAYFQP